MKFKNQKVQFSGLLPSRLSLIWDCAFPKELYKYSSSSSVQDVLINKELVFVCPNLWKDSFEKRYLDTDFTDLGIKQPKIYCMCFATKVENEEAEWKFYSYKKKMTIRCRINIEPLFEILSDFAQKNDVHIFIGNANYELSKKEIQFLHLPKSKNFSSYFEDFSLDKYMKLMTLKPKERKNENEFRIFVVPKNEDRNSEDIFKIPIPEDKYDTLFSNFMVQPFENAYSDNPKDLKYMEDSFQAMRELFADKLLSLYPYAKIDHYKQLDRYRAVNKLSLKLDRNINK